MTTFPRAARAPLPGRRVPGVRVAGAVLLAAVAVAGCGTVSSPVPDAARPMAAPTSEVAPVVSSTPAPDCGDARVSLRPPARMPAPGGPMPAGSLMETVQKRGYLRVGVLTDVPPFDSVDPATGTFEGLDIDIATDIARAIFGPAGIEDHIRFRAITNAERIPVIENNDVDIVVATMTVNCDRRQHVDFSVPYYNSVAKVLVVKGSPYRSLDDLGGKKVCAAAGTTSLLHIVEARSHPVPYSVTNVADCLVALQQGKIDAVSTDDTILYGMAQQDPHLEVVGPVLADEPDAVAVSKVHPEMTRFVNGVLAQIEADGTWARQVSAHLQVTGAAPPVAMYRD